MNSKKINIGPFEIVVEKLTSGDIFYVTDGKKRYINLDNKFCNMRDEQNYISARIDTELLCGFLDSEDQEEEYDLLKFQMKKTEKVTNNVYFQNNKYKVKIKKESLGIDVSKTFDDMEEAQEFNKFCTDKIAMLKESLNMLENGEIKKSEFYILEEKIEQELNTEKKTYERKKKKYQEKIRRQEEQSESTAEEEKKDESIVEIFGGEKKQYVDKNEEKYILTCNCDDYDTCTCEKKNDKNVEEEEEEEDDEDICEVGEEEKEC